VPLTRAGAKHGSPRARSASTARALSGVPIAHRRARPVLIIRRRVESRRPRASVSPPRARSANTRLATLKRSGTCGRTSGTSRSNSRTGEGLTTRLQIRSTRLVISGSIEGACQDEQWRHSVLNMCANAVGRGKNTLAPRPEPKETFAQRTPTVPLTPCRSACRQSRLLRDHFAQNHSSYRPGTTSAPCHPYRARSRSNSAVCSRATHLLRFPVLSRQSFSDRKGVRSSTPSSPRSRTPYQTHRRKTTPHPPYDRPSNSLRRRSPS
jgi:hypothetical protein